MPKPGRVNSTRRRQPKDADGAIRRVIQMEQWAELFPEGSLWNRAIDFQL
jgi:hypothetical protein